MPHVGYFFDPLLYFENPPSDGETKKGPNSDWGFDHKADPSAHHTKTGSGEIDHGEVQGLGDDDHTQYLNTTRHDVVARHPLANLDSAVCSEAEADSKIAAHKANPQAHQKLGSFTSRNLATIYQAATDGFVLGNVEATVNAVSSYLEAQCDATTPPSTVRARASCCRLDASGVHVHMNSFLMPVKKDWYYRVNLHDDGEAPVTSLYWIPLG